jgi:uncharacterized protein involved in exopolysaccharide biosynthesis
MNEEEIDLKEYLKVIKKKWMFIIGIFLVTLIVSLVISSKLPKVYQASTLITIGRIRNQQLENIPAIIEILKQKPFLREIAQDLKMPFDEENLYRLKQRIRIEETAGLLEITGKGRKPEMAVELVNSVTKILLERHRRLLSSGKQILEDYIQSYTTELKNLKNEIENLKEKIKQLEKSGSEADALIAQGYMERLENTLSRYENLERDLKEKRMEGSYGTEDTKISATALLPEKPVSLKKRQIILIAGILGIFLGIMFAFFQEYLSKT